MSANLTDREFEELLGLYRSEFDKALDDTIDAIVELRASGEVSEEMTRKILKFLISKHVASQINTEIHNEGALPKRRPRKTLRYMRLAYGRTTEEIYAV